MKRVLLALTLMCALASSVSAQTLAAGSITANGGAVTAGLRRDPDVKSISIQITGTWTGTITFQVTNDGSTYVSRYSGNASTSSAATSTTSNGIFEFTNTGYVSVRAIATAAWTGTAVVTINQGPGSGGAGGGGSGGGTVAISQTSDENLVDVGVGGTTVGQTNPVPVRLSNGTDYLTLPNDATLGTSTFTEATSTAPGLFYRNDTPDSLVNTTNEATAAGVNANGALWVSFIDPCSSEVKTTDPFSITADTVIIAAAASKKNYICSIVVVAGAAEIVSITEGTGSTCGTSEAALVGSTTDANGLSFAANSGFQAIGGGTVAIAGKTANVDTCLNVSGSNRVSGFVTWVQR